MSELERSLPIGPYGVIKSHHLIIETYVMTPANEKRKTNRKCSNLPQICVQMKSIIYGHK